MTISPSPSVPGRLLRPWPECSAAQPEPAGSLLNSRLAPVTSVHSVRGRGRSPVPYSRIRLAFLPLEFGDFLTDLLQRVAEKALQLVVPLRLLFFQNAPELALPESHLRLELGQQRPAGLRSGRSLCQEPHLFGRVAVGIECQRVASSNCLIRDLRIRTLAPIETLSAGLAPYICEPADIGLQSRF